MPLFGKKKKEETSADAEGNKKEKPEAAPPTKKVEKAPPGRRTVAKPTEAVEQKSTQVLYRLNYAVKQRAVEPSRSSELVPLNKEFEYMRKHLRSLVQAAKNYQKAMDEVAKARGEFVAHSAKMAEGTPLADAVASQKVVLGESFVTLQAKVDQKAEQSSTAYQTQVLDYLVEWEAIITTKIEAEVKYTQKLQKNLKHYETKVEKLRKTVAAKEAAGKEVAPQMSEKLQRNEDKLKETHQEFEDTATKTCHLLQEATEMGWKDFHPWLKAVMKWEYERAADELEVIKPINDVKNKVVHVAETLDRPLPASAFTEVVLYRPSEDSGDLSDEDLE